MRYVRCLRGLASGVAYPHDVPMNLDPVDGRPVMMELDVERLRAELAECRYSLGAIHSMVTRVSAQVVRSECERAFPELAALAAKGE